MESTGPSPREWAALVFLAALCGAFWIAGRAPRPSGRTPPAEDLFERAVDFSDLPEIRLTIAPGDIRALNAGIPADLACSREIRQKSVPVAEVSLDGKKLSGKFSVRYRGFCHQHWGHAQKSLKLQADSGKPLYGYQTLNLNALNSDPFLYEAWATALLRRAGGIAARVGFAKLWINGRYNGIRELSENLDADLLSAQALPKGAIYRERSHAGLGGPRSGKPDLKSLWKKNSMKRDSWEDLEALDAEIAEAVRAGGRARLERVSLDDYLTYNAIISITATTHLNDHNIPMYRPKRETRFRPIGYDFDSPNQARHARIVPEIQSPYAAMNWLSQLLWADRDTRLALHRLTAAMIERFGDTGESYDPLFNEFSEAIAGDLAAGRTHDALTPAPRDPRALRAANTLGETLRRRAAFLKREYLHPLARVEPGWREQSRFQAAVEGAGLYELRISGPASCSPGQSVRIRSHLGDWRTAIDCASGTASASPVEIERNDIRPPAPDEKNYFKRNSAGVVLIDVDNPGRLPLDSLAIRSLQTGTAVPVEENWPFRIRTTETGAALIGRPRIPYRKDFAASKGDGYFLARLPDQSAFTYDPSAGRVEFNERVPGPLRSDEYGPVLCWRIDGRTACHEFHPGYDLAERPDPSPASAIGERVLEAERFRSCRVLTVEAGDWRVPAPIEGGPDCTVSFAAGARLRFERRAWMRLTGETRFPETGDPVRFEPVKDLWAGLILEPKDAPCRVVNAFFRRSAEFRRKGERYTGALSLRPGGRLCVVRGVRFEDILGDDAINIRSGELRLSSSSFARVRDGVDMDGASGTLEDLRIESPADDGVDLGDASPVLIRRLFVSGAGDKGISVGPDSAVRVEDSRIERANAGITVRERASAALDGVVFTGNETAIAVSRSADAGANDVEGRLSGNAVFRGNKLDFAREGKPENPPPGLNVLSD